MRGSPRGDQTSSAGTAGLQRWPMMLAWVAALLSPLTYLLHLPRFGRLPYNDYYDLLPQLVVDGRLTLDPVAYLVLKSNEHTIALPAAVYALNASLFHGDNRVLSLFTLACMACVFALLVRWIPEEVERRPLTLVPALVVVSVLVFNLMAAHNVVRGFSGTIWCLANVFAVGAFTVLSRSDGPGGARRVAVAIGLGVLGVLSYSTGLGTWPALLVGGLLLGLGRARLGALVAATMVVVPLYLANVQRPAHHVEPNTTDPVQSVVYLWSYLGGGVLSRPGPALALGCLGAVAGVLLSVGAIRRGRAVRRAAAPWVMLMVYAAANGVGTAVGRSNLGVEQALASRYATLSAFFWLGVLGTALALAQSATSARRRRLGAAGVAILGVVLASLTAANGLRLLSAHVAEARYQAPAELALRYGIRDDEMLRHLTPFPQGALRATDVFREIGHVPFDREPRFPHGSVVEGSVSRPSTAAARRGSVTREDRVDGRVHRIGGWLAGADVGAGALPVVDAEGVVHGVVFGGFSVPGGPPPGLQGRDASGWIGYLLPPPGRRELWIVDPRPEARSVRALLEVTPKPPLSEDRTLDELVDRNQREALEALGYLDWAEVQEGEDPAGGVTVLDRSRVQAGLTLFTPRRDRRAVLVDLHGRIVHEWRADGSGGPWQHVDLCDNGDLLVLVKEERILRLDPSSREVWSLAGRFHHEVREAPDGGVLAAARRDATVRRGGRVGPLLVDELVELDAGGRVERRTPLTELFRHVPGPARLGRIRAWAEKEGLLRAVEQGRAAAVLMPDTPADVFHLNSVQRVTTTVRGVCAPGDLLISVRNLDTLAVVDPASRRIRWRWGPGELDRQHHPTLLDGGTILVFDNGRRREASRVVEVDPVQGRILWSYEGSADDPFYSSTRGSAQRLPNGNTLVCESDRGRLFEVTRSGDTVWEYLAPMTSPDPETGEPRRAAVYRAERIVELPAALRRVIETAGDRGPLPAGEPSGPSP